jgi:5-guanidino-2-oxopentanoate decarboxylase
LPTLISKTFNPIVLTMTDTTIGEALVSLLEAYGVDRIFGIPGVHNVEMYRGLPRSQINHVLTRHEQGAGFMADGYARATGKPGVCFTITGPGLTNILTPMGQAWSDSSNILVISSALDIADSAQGRGRLHEMRSQIQAAQSVTAHATRSYTEDDIEDAVARAFSNFASSRPRPAYLEIPLDLFSAPARNLWTAQPVAHRPHASTHQVSAAVAMLKKAERPFIILGGGALTCGAAALRIAQATGAPILTTTAGKGAIPADHENAWGYVLGYPETQSHLQKSDCILAVGTELSETDFWAGSYRVQAPMIRIDLDPDVLARPHRAALPIRADAAATLDAIAKNFEGHKPCHTAPPATLDDPLRSILAKALQVIRESLPADTVIASDMTQIAYAANEIFPVSHPRTWLHPVGFGTLGFALPAAIGAKFGVGEKPVAALAGDYGLQYTLNELGTAVEHKLPIPILLWNNSSLAQIHDGMVDKGIQPNAVTLRNPNFPCLAKAYGAAAARPQNLRELAKAITLSLKADGPTLIEMSEAMVRG